MIKSNYIIKRRVVALALAMIFMLSVVITNIDYSYAAVTNLGINRVQQAQSNWCWAASSQMLGQFVRASCPGQASIVRAIMGWEANQGANDTQLKNALAFATERSANYTGVYPYSSITATMNGGRGLIAKFLWNSGTAHAVVFSGYNTSSSLVRITDPASGCATASYAYSNLVAGTQIKSGTGRYTTTYYYS